MTAERPPSPAEPDDGGFGQAQQAALGAIGQALIGLSTPGTAAIDLTVTQAVDGATVNLDFRLNLERQSGLTVPGEADDALVEAVQQLVLLWREHGRQPWQTFSYRLSRGPSGPVFTSSFEL
jgi:hypothetical protein